MKPIKLNLSKNENFILKKYNIVYILSKEFKKRLTRALKLSKKHKFKNILIVVNKNNLRNTVQEISNLNLGANIIVVTFESLNKVVANDYNGFYIMKSSNDYKKYVTELKDSRLTSVVINSSFKKPDVIIVDPAHRLGTYPKLNKAAQNMRKLSKNIPIIALGFNITNNGKQPRLFNQLYAFHNTKYMGFDDFAKKNILVKTANFLYRSVKLYDILNVNGKKWYNNVIDKLVVQVKESKYSDSYDEIKSLEIPKNIEEFIDSILMNGVLRYNNKTYSTIETEVKYKYIKQLLSGTIKLDDRRYVVNDFKAKYINKYKNQKILILYRYLAEKELLENRFKNKKNVTISGYVSNMPNEKFDKIIIFTLPAKISRYQEMLMQYKSIKKIYIFTMHKFEYDMYNKLKMQLASL